MNRFIKDMKRYFAYAKFAARADLKAEVASSYLNWLWWVLDPLLFMMVYTFIAIVVFRSSVQYFPLFVFVGLTLWNFFNKTVIQSVKLVRNNSSIVSKVYVPKYILLLKCNPVSMLIESARRCMLYSSLPYRKLIVLWGIVSVLLCWIGVKTIYKYENSYVKGM